MLLISPYVLPHWLQTGRTLWMGWMHKDTRQLCKTRESLTSLQGHAQREGCVTKTTGAATRPSDNYRDQVMTRVNTVKMIWKWYQGNQIRKANIKWSKKADCNKLPAGESTLIYQSTDHAGVNPTHTADVKYAREQQDLEDLCWRSQSTHLSGACNRSLRPQLGYKIGKTGITR